jgi:hypothetical protein
MGCGSGGSYLYRLLRRRMPSLDITLYDRPTSNPCGIKGCAWGLSRPLFSQLCREIGILPEKYFLGSYDHIIVNGRRLKADLVIINKPALVSDLLGAADLLNPSMAQLEGFTRIIDATGYERSYLPPVTATPVAAAVQIRLKAKPPEAPTAVLNYRGGYSWLFPAGGAEVHLGALSPAGFDTAREELKEMMGTVDQSRAICSCRGHIRCHGPVTPFVEGRVWGLGEAIGLVDPVTGAGIVPAMVSAKLLVDNWDSPKAYEQAVLHRYSYMIKEANILNRLMAGQPLTSRDLFFPRQALETIGISPSFFELAGLVMKAASDYLSHRRQ